MIKKLLLSIIVFFIFNTSTAQDIISEADVTVYKDSTVDIAPDFPGGTEAFYKFFLKEFKHPQVHSLIDKVVLSFIVEPDGTLSDIRIMHDAGFGTGEQALEIMQTCPKWLPGSIKGKPVRVFHSIPIAVVTKD